MHVLKKIGIKRLLAGVSMLTIMVAAVSSLPQLAAANPKNGTVKAGSATITTTNPTTLNIEQSSNRAVIDWEEFSIQPGETTQIQQPSANAILLNRVTGSSRSDILGTLNANGRIFLLNPNGILIGNNASINVHSLIASTARLSDDSLMNDDVFQFSAPQDQRSFVINRGDITVDTSGLAALVAPWVVNDGLIAAKLGRIALASGGAFTVDLFGDGLINLAVNPGLINDGFDVDGVPVEGRVRQGENGRLIADGGQILLTAAAASSIVDHVINMDGLAQATSFEQTAGKIVLRDTSDSGSIRVGGTLDATGTNNSGEVGGTIAVLSDEILIDQNAVLDVSGDVAAGSIILTRDLASEGGTNKAATLVRTIEGSTFKATTSADNRTDEPVTTTNLNVGEQSNQQISGAGFNRLLESLFGSDAPDPLEANRSLDGDPTRFQRGKLVLIEENAALADRNRVGIYDQTSPDLFATLFDGADQSGAEVHYALVDRGSGFEVFVDGAPALDSAGGPIVFKSNRVGFFIDTPPAPPFFDDPVRNADKQRHVAAIPIDGLRFSEDDRIPTSLRGKTQEPQTLLLGFEDKEIKLTGDDVQPFGSDTDHNDLAATHSPNGVILFAAARADRNARAGDNNGGDNGGNNGPAIPGPGGDCAATASCGGNGGDGGGGGDGGDGGDGGTGVGGTGGGGGGIGGDGGGDPVLRAALESCESLRTGGGASNASINRCFAAVTLAQAVNNASTALASISSDIDGFDEIRQQEALAAIAGTNQQLTRTVRYLVQSLGSAKPEEANIAVHALDRLQGYANGVLNLAPQMIDERHPAVAEAAIDAIGNLGIYGLPGFDLLPGYLDNNVKMVSHGAARGITSIDSAISNLTIPAQQFNDGRITQELTYLTEVRDGNDTGPIRCRAMTTMVGLGEQSLDDSGDITLSLSEDQTLANVDALTQSIRVSAASMASLLEALADKAPPAGCDPQRLSAPQFVFGTLPLDQLSFQLKGLTGANLAYGATQLERTLETVKSAQRQIDTMLFDDIRLLEAQRGFQIHLESTRRPDAGALLDIAKQSPIDAKIPIMHAVGLSEPLNPTPVIDVLLDEARTAPTTRERRAAYQALSDLNQPLATNTLASLLNQCADDQRRIDCLNVIQALNDPGSVSSASGVQAIDQGLVPATGADDPILNYSAAQLLANIKGEPTANLNAFAAAASIDGETIDRLTIALNDPDPLVKERALEELEAAGPRAVRALPDIVEMMAITTGGEQLNLTRASIEISRSASRAVSLIESGLAADDPDLRSEANRALQQMSVDIHRADPVLKQAVTHPDRLVRTAAALSMAELVGFGAAITAALMDAASEESDPVRQQEFAQASADQAHAAIGPQADSSLSQ